MHIAFSTVCCMPPEDVRRNMAYAHTLGLPDVGDRQRPGTRVAVVGGGPSVRDHLDELCYFDGEIWAVNAMAQVLANYGIKSTLFAADPDPVLLACCEGVDSAILASACHTSAFDALLARGADVSIFDIGGPGRKMGPTTASAAPSVALAMACHEVVFYGCESSYGEIKSLTAERYAGHHDNRFTGKWMRVACGGSEFMTDPELSVQAEVISAVLRQFPQVFKDRSGGLLGAMAAHEAFDTLEVSNALMATLRPIISQIAARPATMDDAGMLYAWCNHEETRQYLGGESASFEDFKVALAEWLERTDRRILVFTMNGDLVGCTLMEGRDTIDLTCIVAPAIRRKGVGTTMLNAITASAGGIALRGEVGIANEAARKMAERCGFARIGEAAEIWQRG